MLQQINKETMNVTNLSKELNLTTQEASRHLSRLTDVGLTQKDNEGSYHLTLYGELVLTQTEALAFTSKYRDYFTSHLVIHLPPPFVTRISDLAGSICIDDISDTFYRVDKVIQEAEECICTITDQHLMSTYPLLREAVRKDVQIKNIEARDWVVSPDIRQAWHTKEAVHSVWAEARTEGLLQEKILHRLDIFLYMSEKEVAGVAFPLQNGKFDYLGFAGTDERTLKWCMDLFQYYWGKARSRREVVEELYRWIRNKPKTIRVLKGIAARKKTGYEKELLSELESKGLIRHGELTVLGDFVYTKLQQ
jgi:predicted transcriptional regulator